MHLYGLYGYRTKRLYCIHLSLPCVQERLAATGLNGIVQTVLPFDLRDRFLMADGRPLPSDMREPARWYVAARLRKLRERLVKTFGGAGLISPSPPALMDTRWGQAWPFL